MIPVAASDVSAAIAHPGLTPVLADAAADGLVPAGPEAQRLLRMSPRVVGH